MGRKAQALLELALFLGLMLMVLLAALSYQRNLREQRATDENVFSQAETLARDWRFTEKDIDEETTTCSGAIVSYSLNADRQANRLFQGGQRRTAASSVSMYYSNAEDPPNLDYNYYNATDISLGEKPKKITTPRLGGTEDPEDALKLNAADWCSILYPVFSSLVQGLFNLKDATWWANWGGYLDTVLRAAAFGWLAYHYAVILDKMNDSDDQRQALKDQDEKYGDWGWRIPDWVHDRNDYCPGISKDDIEKCEKILGALYVKEITPQVYDIESLEAKSIDYNETQQATPGYTGVRSVTVGDNVKRKILRRYDESIDPTLPLPQHIFVEIGEKGVTVDLSGGQRETWN